MIAFVDESRGRDIEGRQVLVVAAFVGHDADQVLKFLVKVVSSFLGLSPAELESRELRFSWFLRTALTYYTRTDVVRFLARVLSGITERGEVRALITTGKLEEALELGDEVFRRAYEGDRRALKSLTSRIGRPGGST